jgi:hypothetical protein
LQECPSTPPNTGEKCSVANQECSKTYHLVPTFKADMTCVGPKNCVLSSGCTCDGDSMEWDCVSDAALPCKEGTQPKWAYTPCVP